MSKRDIIIVGQQPWDTSIGSNCKNLALEFSKHNRVLYVNSPLDRFNLLKNKNDPKVRKRLEIIKSKKTHVELIGPDLWTMFPAKISESVSWIKIGWLFDFFNRLNNKRIAADIRTAVEKLGFKDFILFNDNDIYRSFYLKDLLNPKVSIYYSRDYMLAVDYWKRHGERLEPKLIAKSDICVANSTYLSEYCKKYNNKSYFVGQGCDLEIFTKGGWHIPDEIKPLTNQPIIGYVGALQTLRLDIQIFEHIAKHRPGYNVVLVGPEDEQFKVSGLHMMKNVFFLGAKHPDELPAYINMFDVCLNPQILNEVTIGNYPRKIDEYLAMGKPVVATRTKAMEFFADYTYLAENREEYIRLIDKALKEDTAELREKRKKFSATHTWENNVAEIYKAVLTVDGFE